MYKTTFDERSNRMVKLIKIRKSMFILFSKSITKFNLALTFISDHFLTFRKRISQREKKIKEIAKMKN